MIGILGPRDSVTLAQQVALEFGRSNELLGLAYQHVDEAVDMGRSLESMCEVLLFTGLVPFERAKRAGKWQCELDVIQHSQTDLYRIIGLILKETANHFPRVSVDSLEMSMVSDVFGDMGLPIPEVVIPIIDAGAFVFEDVEGTARAHLAALERGEVEAALTCLAGTHRLVAAAGMKSWRIDHARVTIVEALQRAWLASDLRRTEGSSIAVVLVQPVFVDGRSSTNASALRARVDRSVTSNARRMGSMVAMEGNRYLLTTTKAAVHEMLGRYRNGQKSLVDLATKAPAGVATTLGVGFGGTFATALDSAEKAFQFSSASREPTVAHEDGTVASLVAGGHEAVNLRETSEEILDLAERTGLGPLSLRRLITALGRADHRLVTAQQLAEFYGVLPRSARRMLGLLVAAGYAREVGVRGSVGAGRPHVVYDVDLTTLRRIMASGPGKQESH